MIQRILGAQFARVASAAFLIGGFSVLSRLLGLARNRIFTEEFGAGQTLDIYYAAFLIPDFIYNILVLGLLSAVFIPIFSEYFHKDQKEAWHFANISLNTVIILVSGFSLVLYVLMPWILPLLVSGFSEEMKLETVRVSRLMLLSPVFLGMSSIFGSIIQNFRKYVYYSLAPIFYNIGIILGVIFLSFWGVYGLAIGVVLGAFMHFLIQMIGAFNSGFRYRMIFDWQHLGFLKMGRLSVARFFSIAFSQVNAIIITAIASLLAVGSISIFNLANDIQYLPIGVIALSYAISIFPVLSSAVAKNDKDNFFDELFLSVRQVLFFVLPMSVILILMSREVVVLLYGFFDTNDTIIIAAALAIFSVSIFAQSAWRILSRAYYAVQNTMIPFFSSAISVIATVTFSFIFIYLFNAKGYFYDSVSWLLGLESVPTYMVVVLSLPMAFSIGEILNFIILALMFKKNMPWPVSFGSVFAEGSKIVAASLAIIPFVLASKWTLMSLLIQDSYIFVVVGFAVASLIGAVVYCFILWILRSDELNIFLNMIFSMFKKSERKKAKEELPENIEEGSISGKES